jgi:putative heme-binding domain-containing protein
MMNTEEHCMASPISIARQYATAPALQLAVGLMLALSQQAAAAELDYAAADKDLKVVLLDSDPKESFLAVQADGSGRLFVGGREALFVYEPLRSTGSGPGVPPVQHRRDAGAAGYEPRRELLRFPDHTWIYDIAIRGNDLYVLTVSALYLIPDGVVKREGLAAKRLVWGVPLGHVHQCFHGMALGPEGDIYFAMGDPLWYYGDFNRPDHWGHWTFFSQPEGTRTPYTGVGGVFRCRPDGSRFQVVARGLRNSCGLCFDRHWNLFTNDNDHEGLPAGYVPGRLVHVTPHTYFSWPRGWLVSKTPERADLLETMTDALGRAVPVGQAYYDETFLPSRLRNNLLVARWCTRAVTRYPLEPRGASFSVHEAGLLAGRNDARPVGVGVGRGGRIFATISHMAHNDGSPVYRGDLVMITRADDPETYPFEGYVATEADPARLWSELAHASFERRYRAHTEILRRGGKLLEEAVDRLARSIGVPPVLKRGGTGVPPVEHRRDDGATGARKADVEHLVWLAGASESKRAAEVIGGLTQHRDPMLRLQAIRALTEFPALGAMRETFVRALADAHPQVQHAAVLGLFNFEGPVPEEAIAGAARSPDSYLRQAATLLAAEKCSLEEITRLCQSQDMPTRLAGVLAAGFRLTVPPATEPIPEHLPLDPEFRGPVIEFAEKTVDLRKLGRVGNFTVADHWKVGRHTAEQERLFTTLLARLSDSSEPVRLQAAHFLEVLNDPRSEPQVVKVRTASEDRRLALAPLKHVNQVWVCGPFNDGDEGFKRVHPPEQAAIDLSAAYGSGSRSLIWTQAATPRLFDLVRLLGPAENASYYVYFRLESGSRQRINLLVGSDDGIRVWQNGLPLFTNEVSRAALPYQDVIVLTLEPGSNDILMRVHNVSGASGAYAHYRSLQPAAHVLPEKLTTATLAERLSAAGDGGVKLDQAFFKVDWSQAAREGDPRQGRKLFESLACVKCHAVTADAALAGGPSLADAGRRFTVPYLVESVLLPSKQVSPVFRSTAIVTKDGQQFHGLVVGETADKLELLLPDTKRREVAKSDIDQRELQNLSPMPQGVVKTPAELRDLLAYLLRGNDG